MNRIVSILILATLVLGVSVIGTMLYIARQGSSAPTPYGGSNPTLPNDNVTPVQVGADTNSQTASKNEQAVLAAYMTALNAVGNLDNIKPGPTVVSGTFALQVWGGDHTSGEALLRYDSANGWVILSPGGGLWGVAPLMKYGMDKATALTLLHGVPLR